MPNIPESEAAPENNESFADLLQQYERSHTRPADGGARQLEGTVVALTADSVILDVGFKSEGMLPLTAFPPAAAPPKAGDKLLVSVKGRDAEGYYQLSLGKIRRPTDWPALERAFAEKANIVGTVTAVVKGGVSVDVGVRAFMPASRSGTHDAAELAKLVGLEISCRIIKLDTAEEDVVVDRRVVAEEEARAGKERLLSQLQEGDTVTGTVRSLTDYGAFLDIGGVDALLHVGDMSWGRVSKPADVLSVGQSVEGRILKISNDADKRRISVGLKQLLPDPWAAAAEKYKAGERIRGTVTRVADFGAFVELEPGIEGLIHVSEMSWVKRVRAASDVLKPGENVEAVILGVSGAERRISLGLKQTLGDPWNDVPQKFPEGSIIEGPITSITKFGAFVQLAEGVEGMIHISEISAERRLNHPQDMLKLGQVVRAQVLAVDREKRQIRLSMKQAVPGGLDEYLAEHKEGDVVSGRLLEQSSGTARVELGDGVYGSCKMAATVKAEAEPKAPAKADLSTLTSMLNARWKSGPSAATPKPEAGQVRSFRIKRLDVPNKKIELELA
jgi:small subunit ribosomal protein S1